MPKEILVLFFAILFGGQLLAVCFVNTFYCTNLIWRLFWLIVCLFFPKTLVSICSCLFCVGFHLLHFKSLCDANMFPSVLVFVFVITV